MTGWLGAGCLLLSLTLWGTGCGGDDRYSPEEYFERVERAQRRAEQRTADDASESAPRFRNGADILRDFREDLRELTPPTEAAIQHDAYVDAVGNLVAHMDDLLRRVDNAKSRAELDALNEEWSNNPKGNELEDEVRLACEYLQLAADARDISVELCYRPRGP